MESGFEHDPQSQDGQACPRNHFGLTSYGELSHLERVYVQQRTMELLRGKAFRGSFDTDHLRGIHRFLFRDVFPWAGELRVVSLAKPGGAPFAVPAFIQPALETTFGQLRDDGLLRTLSAERFAARAGFYLGEINAVHPFREGNGRTQREFVRQLAMEAGHTISWAGFTQEQMVAASILAHTRGDHSELGGMIRAAILPKGTEDL